MKKIFTNDERYLAPPFSLLEHTIFREKTEREQKEIAYRIQETLRSFGVQVTITNISRGPLYTRYELKPERGVRVSAIVNLLDDIRIRIAAREISIEAPIPGKSAIGIDVLNDTRRQVYLRELLESLEFRCFDGELPFTVGKDIGGRNVLYDLVRTPHLLLGGATGTGKSVFIHSIILSLLYRNSPSKVRFLMIDPQGIELSLYRGIPHLIAPAVSDVRKTSAALNWAVAEMDKRFKCFAAAGVRDLEGFNSIAVHSPYGEFGQQLYPFPRLVIIINELTDLMLFARSEVESALYRLTQAGRIAGIHLIIATQRPSVDFVTGMINTNMLCRIAFAVTRQADSRRILNVAGAEKLLGNGDMLFFPRDYQRPVRIKGAFASVEEVTRVVDYIKRYNPAEAHEREIDRHIYDIAANGISAMTTGEVETDLCRDEFFAKAGRFIIEKNKASIGLLQRVFKIGFNRADCIMDQLAEAGVVSQESSTRARRVLMTMPEFEQFLENER